MNGFVKKVIEFEGKNVVRFMMIIKLKNYSVIFFGNKNVEDFWNKIEGIFFLNYCFDGCYFGCFFLFINKKRKVENMSKDESNY